MTEGMSDKTEWRAELLQPFDDKSWRVVERASDGHIVRVVFSNLDKSTAHRIAAVNELEAALKHTVKEWDGEPEDMHDARMALAKARGDDPPEGRTND